MSGDAALATIALLAFATMITIGASVMSRPRMRLDIDGLTLRGRGTPLAVVLTRSGYWPALSAITIALFGISLALHVGTTFAIALGATQLVTQWLAERVKRIVRRGRPDDWLFHQELGFSFPSGHATTAVVSYGGLVLFVWTQPLPDAVRVPVTAILAIWIVGIPWSRMVLAAHYATDVLGGMCFGAGSLALMALALRHLPARSIFG